MLNKFLVVAFVLLIVGSQAQVNEDNSILSKMIKSIKPTPVKDSKVEVQDFVKGFLEGIKSAPLFDNIKACIIDDEQVAADIKKAIELIKTKSPEKVKEGIELLGKVAHTIPTACEACKAASVDMQRLLALVHSFTSPKSFLYHVGKSLMINHVEVIGEVNAAMDAYFAHNFNRLGFFIGKAMDTIFLGDERTSSELLVNHLNQVSGWEATNYDMFKDMTVEEFKSRYLGANLMDYSKFENLTVMNYEGLKNDIPTAFHSGEQWPGCVHEIRNQGKCGSCWAFAASEVLSDRFCIASNKSINLVLSPQYLVSCDNILDHGCNGGNPVFSWWFIARKGLVTETCLPYAAGEGKNPPCSDFKTCADGQPIKKYYTKKGSLALLTNPESIQNNIMQYGPAEAAFTVYEDFKAYKGGIYKHTSGGVLGGHAVKIVGWGSENGTNYWIVANSWTTGWGEKGFFRIAFGECGIDKAVTAGQADLERSNKSELLTFW